MYSITRGIWKLEDSQSSVLKTVVSIFKGSKRKVCLMIANTDQIENGEFIVAMGNLSQKYNLECFEEMRNILSDISQKDSNLSSDISVRIEKVLVDSLVVNDDENHEVYFDDVKIALDWWKGLSTFGKTHFTENSGIEKNKNDLENSDILFVYRSRKDKPKK